MPSIMNSPNKMLESMTSPQSYEQRWSFANPVKLLFGDKSRRELPGYLAGCTSTLVVTTPDGRQRLHGDPLLADWAQSPQLKWMDKVTENPGLHDLQTQIDALSDTSIDSVVALGGGSALDSAKVLAVSLGSSCRGHALVDLLTSANRPINDSPVPLYVLPTTSGTGSEVTPFATVWDHRQKKKYSLAGPDMFPTLAIVDPELTYTLPMEATISTGLDAINQASESIWNRHANPITLQLATRALKVGIPALIQLSDSLDSPEARRDLAEASLLAGLAISHTRTALCHSMSYPITAHFGVAHGLACAFTMVSVLQQCITVDDGRLARLAVDLFGPAASTHQLIGLYIEITDRLEVRKRVACRIDSLDALQMLVPEMITPGRADNCMVAVDPSLLTEILNQSWNR